MKPSKYEIITEVIFFHEWKNENFSTNGKMKVDVSATNGFCLKNSVNLTTNISQKQQLC